MTWGLVQLRRLASITMGQSPPGETYNGDGEGLPFFQGKAEFAEEHPITTKWCSAPSRVAEPGDVLLSIRAPVGPTNVAVERCCIGRGLAAIRAQPDVLDQRYLRYVLRFKEKDLARRGQGSTFDAIGRADVEQIAIPLPPVSEQRRIVDILDQADSLRRLRAEADSKADRVVPALYRNLFVNRASDWPREALGTRLRKSKGSLQSGPFGSHLHNSDFVESGPVQVVGIDNVLDGEFSEGRDRRITAEKYEELKKYTLESGDVLVTIMGTVGRCCVFPQLKEPAICTKHVYRIQVDEQLDPEYVSAAIRFDPSVTGQLGASITGQIVAAITSDDIRRLTLLIPSSELQQSFAACVRASAQQRAERRRTSAQLDRLFQTLLRGAFSGRLTARWRDGQTNELLKEMEHQAKALAEAH